MQRKTNCLGGSWRGIEVGEQTSRRVGVENVASLLRIGDLYFDLGKTSLLPLLTNPKSERYQPDQITPKIYPLLQPKIGWLELSMIEIKQRGDNIFFMPSPVGFVCTFPDNLQV